MEPIPVDGPSSGCDNSSSPVSAAVSCTTGSSQTEIRVEKVTHNWTVKNFSHCYQEYLENHVFLAKGKDTLSWSVKIYPKGNGENNKDFVFLCLNRSLYPPTSNSNLSAAGNQMPVSGGGKFGGEIGFKSKFTLRNSEQKEIEMRIHPNPSHSDYVSYIKRDVLFPQILPQDIIVVTVDIDVAVETVTQHDSTKISIPNTDEQLANDYQSMLKEPHFSDFTINVGGRGIPVHRAIVSTRSTVMAAMLAHDTEEAKTGSMEITDLEYDVVQEMLKFLYSGRCERIKELGMDLLVAADKYSIIDLKLQCESELVGALSVENVCQLLTLSELHSAARLREKALDFILLHPAEVTTTDGWQMMLQERPSLVTEIVKNFK